MFYGNESPFTEFPLGREAARCSLTSISSTPSPRLAFSAPPCSQLPFAEQHCSEVAGWSYLLLFSMSHSRSCQDDVVAVPSDTPPTRVARQLCLLTSPTPGSALPIAARTCPAPLPPPWAVPRGHTAALRLVTFGLAHRGQLLGCDTL